MWTQFFITFLVLQGAVSRLPAKPSNVSFSSVNLRNVLHWIPGKNTPEGTHFSVEYIIYDNASKWKAVHQCTNISRTWCDLSAETWDTEEDYFARVRAVWKRSSSKWATTKKFDPKWDTIFGPPRISVGVENNSAIISLIGPERHSPNNQIPALPMKEIYPRMIYFLFIHDVNRNRMNYFPIETTLYKYNLLEYSTKYCFSAKSKILTIPVQSMSSAWYCITTPQDPFTVRLLVGIVVPIVCVCFIGVIGFLLRKYLTGDGQKSPYILSPDSFYPKNVIMFICDKPNFLQTSLMPEKPAPPEPPSEYFSQNPQVDQRQNQLLRPPSFDYSSLMVAPRSDRGTENIMVAEHQDCTNGFNNTNNSDYGHITGSYAPQVRTYLCQGPAQKCADSNMQRHDQTEVTTSIKAMPWAQGNATFQLQTPAQALLFQTSQTAGANTMDGESVGLFVSGGHVSGHRSVQIKEEEKQRRENKRIECENVSLLSDYGQQLIKNECSPPSYNPHSLSQTAGQNGEEYMTRTELRLEDVLLRQVSQDELEEPVQDLFTAKYNLVINMDD